jgi:(p)ppGpp synthase/HD superfamily hydrolase
MARTSAARDSRQDLRAGRPLTRRALDYATERHAGQRRDTDGAPYVTHPVEVGSLLSDAGYPDHVVAAGVLHDVLEDTDAERAEIEAGFGPEVAGLVTALTEDDSIEDSRERKAALRLQVAKAGDEAAAVFAADKVSKAREMRQRAAQRPLDESDAAKVEHYTESLDMLETLIPDHELVAQLRSEIEGLPR